MTTALHVFGLLAGWTAVAFVVAVLIGAVIKDGAR